MSSASSTVTYTSVYTDSEPGRVFWGANEEVSDGGPEEPQTPPVPQDEDEHDPKFIQPHDPDYVPEPIYPEYITLEVNEDEEEKDDEDEGKEERNTLLWRLRYCSTYCDCFPPERTGLYTTTLPTLYHGARLLFGFRLLLSFTRGRRLGDF
ncbi:hypothetical protein Tco_1027657 [Tanacetum coccineum]